MLGLLTTVLAASTAPDLSGVSQPSAPVEQERPVRLLSVTASAYSGFPDLVGLSLALHPIPYVDLEATVAMVGLGLSSALRLGPRLTLADGRDARNVGATLVGSLLVGARAFALWERSGVGPDVVFGLDGTWWFAAHFGLTARLTVGAMYDVQRPSVVPDARLGLGFAF